jgi:hypothetical protein
MEAIEQAILDFSSQWEYYCYPDKVEKCKQQVETFLKDIDRLQEEMSTSACIQVKARKKKKRGSSTSRAKCSISFLSTKSQLKNIFTRA